MSAARADAIQLVGEGLEATRGKPAVVGGEDVGPDLDDDGASLGNHFLSYGTCPSDRPSA